jgi:hypothetical protein
VKGVKAGRSIAGGRGGADEGPVCTLVERIVGDQAAQRGHRLVVVTPFLLPCGERAERLAKAAMQPLAVRTDPVVVDPRQEVAAVAVDRPSEPFEIGGARVEAVLEFGDVDDVRDIRPPPDRPVIERQQGVDGRQGVPEDVELTSQVRQSLGIARIGPECERDLFTGQHPVAIQDEIGEQAGVAHAVDAPTFVRDAELSEELDLEHRIPSPVPERYACARRRQACAVAQFGDRPAA